VTTRRKQDHETQPATTGGDGAAYIDTAVAVVPMGDLVGTTIDRYRVLARLGAGGMGEVYRAYDPALDRKVALKVLPPLDDAHHASFEARLRREAQALAKLDHANVVGVYDVGLAEHSVFVAMQLVDGTTVAEHLQAKPRTTREVLELFAAAGRGIAAAHDAGIIHRDVKPSNMLVDKTGRVYVSDFGLARGADEVDAASSHMGGLLHAQMTHAGHVLGTPVYMSPEQHAGEPATARSDQYSFCVSLWEALYREHPFAGVEWTPAAVARMALDEVLQPSRRGGVPARVERALRRGLRHDPAARWPSMIEVVDEIAPRSRSGWIWGAVALVGIAAAVLLTAWLMKAPDRSKICASEADKVHAVWPGKRVPISDPAMAANLDAYAGELASLRVDACEASDASTPLQLRCLDDALHALDDFVGDFATGADAQYLARQLPALADCSSSAQAMLAPIPPGASTKVETIRLTLSRARVIRAIGNGHKAAPSVDAAVADARALGYAPVTAEALLVRAELLDDKLDPEAGTLASEAAEIAVTAHADRTAARAYTLAAVEAADRADFTRLDVLVPVARAAAVRVGTPDVLAAFDHAASRAAIAEARYGDAQALCIEALAQAARTSTATWEADKQHDAVLDDAYGCFSELMIGRGALRAGMPWVSAWLAHLKAAFQSAKPIAGFGALRAKLELDYHAGDYARAADGIRYQMAGVEVTTGIDKGVATFDDVATMERMYRDAGQRSAAVVEARALLAIAKANPLDARRQLVAEIVRGDVAALTDDRATMYTHYATALAGADKLFRPDDDRRAEIRFRIAQAYAQDGAADRADALFVEALAIWQRTGSPHRFDAMAERAALREEQGDCAGAVAGLSGAVHGIEDRLARARAKFELAVCVDITGDRAKARELIGAVATDIGPSSPELAQLAADWLVTHAEVAADDVQWATSVRAVSSEFGADKWSAKQALGQPDVFPRSGDVPQAWASKEADTGSEFVELGFAPIRARGIRIYETFNPGAIASVEAIAESGAHIKAFEAAAPTPAPPASRATTIDLPCTAERIIAVRITLASARVPGWNEIDAVGLVPCR
jgi:hypothetical protein